MRYSVQFYSAAADEKSLDLVESGYNRRITPSVGLRHCLWLTSVFKQDDSRLPDKCYSEPDLVLDRHYQFVETYLMHGFSGLDWRLGGHGWPSTGENGSRCTHLTEKATKNTIYLVEPIRHILTINTKG